MDELPDLTGIPTTSAASFSSEASMSRGHSQVSLMRKQYAGAISALTREIPRSEKGEVKFYHFTPVRWLSPSCKNTHRTSTVNND